MNGIYKSLWEFYEVNNRKKEKRYSRLPLPFCPNFRLL